MSKPLLTDELLESLKEDKNSGLIKSRRIENAKRNSFQSKITTILLIIILLILLLIWMTFEL